MTRVVASYPAHQKSYVWLVSSWPLWFKFMFLLLQVAHGLVYSQQIFCAPAKRESCGPLLGSWIVKLTQDIELFMRYTVKFISRSNTMLFPSYGVLKWCVSSYPELLHVAPQDVASWPSRIFLFTLGTRKYIMNKSFHGPVRAIHSFVKYKLL